MKDQRKNAFAAAVTLMLALSAIAQSVPNLINYQGRLTDQTGAPLVPGFYGIQFKLWDSPSPTTAKLIWAQQQTVALQSNGVFNVILGSPGGGSLAGVTAAVNDLTNAFTANNRYLGLTVVSNTSGVVASPSEILPRQQLLSVPFAVQAQSSQQAQVASNLVSTLANALCPAGSIMAFAGTNVPNGWLLCDGSAVSRINYAALFSAIGTAWGAGDNSTTFNLPDARGVFLRGVNGSRSDALADPDYNSTWRTNVFNGGNIGNAVRSYQADQFGSHKHTLTTWNDDFNASGNGYEPAFGPSDSPNTTKTWDLSYSGGNETRPKNMYVTYIIKY
jgi:microcystin-dependent protein